MRTIVYSALYTVHAGELEAYTVHACVCSGELEETITPVLEKSFGVHQKKNGRPQQAYTTFGSSILLFAANTDIE